MANSTVIREWLVQLGYKVDEASQRKMLSGIEQATVNVIKLGAAIEATAAAFVAGVAKMASSMDNLYWMTQRTKASASNIQALAFAGSQLGTSSEAIKGSIESLSAFLRSSPGAPAFLERLGITVRDPRTGQQRDTALVLEDLGKRLRNMPFYRARLYGQMMGIDDNTLMALMRDTGQFTRIYRQMLQAAGLDADKASKSSHDFMVQIRTLGAAFEILADKVASQLTGRMGGDIEKLRKNIVDHFPQITKVIVSIAKVILTIADNVTSLVVRAGQAIGMIEGWFDSLDGKTQNLIKTFGALLIAWRILSIGFMSSPLGRMMTLLTGILLLFDDYMGWKEGKNSLIDWSKWDSTIQGMKGNFDKVAQTINSLVENTVGWQSVLTAIGIYIAGSWLLGVTKSLGSVISLLRTASALSRGLGAALLLGDLLRRWATGDWSGLPGLKPGGYIDRELRRQHGEDVPEPQGGSTFGQTWLGRGLGWIKRKLFGGNDDLADKDLPPEAQGFLNTIASGESGGDYHKLYGGGQFKDDSQFPDWGGVQLPSGEMTHAAGRYQFQPGTWKEAADALGLKDFSPQSQDKAAWWLAQRDYKARTGRDLLTDLKNPDPRMQAFIAEKLQPTWTSAPRSFAQASHGFSLSIVPHAEAETPPSNATALDNALKRLRSTQNTPPPGVPTSGDTSTSNNNTVAPTINQNTNVVVHGATDPHETANQIQSAQNHVNNRLIRNMQGAIA